MSETSSLSPSARIAIKAVINIVLVWALDTYLSRYFTVFGGIPAYVIIGSLLTLLNMFLRPFLAIVTFPLHLLFTLITTVLVNAFFLYVIYEIILRMDPNIVALAITGGFTGWLFVSLILGIANWVMKHIL